MLKFIYGTPFWCSGLIMIDALAHIFYCSLIYDSVYFILFKLLAKLKNMGEWPEHEDSKYLESSQRSNQIIVGLLV